MNTRKLQEIEKFLFAHRDWNADFQAQEYLNILGNCSSSYDRLISMLYAVANTQSQPNLDALHKFWEHIYAAKEQDLPLTMAGLSNIFGKSLSPQNPFKSIYQALKQQNGWGQKTAALFVKNLINIHASNRRSLYFIADAPAMSSAIQDTDRIYLPVDEVIFHIFRSHIGHEKVSFSSINKCLYEHIQHPSEMLLWDDLWFWGFITQRTKAKTRHTLWNPAKFWSQGSHAKHRKDEVAVLAKDFIRLLGAAS